MERENPMPEVTVVIAHRDKAVRALCARRLRRQKGIRQVSEARSGLEALGAVTGLRPRVLLLDLGLTLGSVGSLVRVIRRKSPRTKVIVLTGRGREAQVVEALAHGAVGYLEKKGFRMFVAKAVRQVDAGEAWVPRKMVAKIIDRVYRQPAA